MTGRHKIICVALVVGGVLGRSIWEKYGMWITLLVLVSADMKAVGEGRLQCGQTNYP